MARIKLWGSIRIKLMFSYLFLTISLVAFFVGFSSIMISRFYYENIKIILSNQTEIISNYYKNYVGAFDRTAELEKMFNDYSSLTFRLQITDLAGNLIKDSNLFMEGKKVNFLEMTGVNSPHDGFYRYMDNASKQELLIHIGTLLNQQQKGGFFILSTTLDNANKTIRQVILFISLVGLVLIMLAFIISRKLSGSITRPILDVITTARNIARGDLTSKATVFNRDETGQLAESINHMSDELRKVDELKNEFISSITHELRTPLTSINGWSIILQDTPKEKQEELRRGLEIIAEESGRLSNMVEDLLDFSRLNAGKLKLKMGNYDLIKIINDICVSMEPRFKTSNIELEVNSMAEELLLPMDPERIKQVLINILDNSIKYSSLGGKIAITVGMHWNEGRQLAQVQITDRGCGISEEDLPHLKKKFYRGKTEQKAKGVGIGLAICEQIIALHHGNLDIQSKPNEGTTVVIELPI